MTSSLCIDGVTHNSGWLVLKGTGDENQEQAGDLYKLQVSVDRLQSSGSGGEHKVMFKSQAYLF